MEKKFFGPKMHDWSESFVTEKVALHGLIRELADMYRIYLGQISQRVLLVVLFVPQISSLNCSTTVLKIKSSRTWSPDLKNSTAWATSTNAFWASSKQKHVLESEHLRLQVHSHLTLPTRPWFETDFSWFQLKTSWTSLRWVWKKKSEKKLNEQKRERN